MIPPPPPPPQKRGWDLPAAEKVGGICGLGQREFYHGWGTVRQMHAQWDMIHLFRVPTSIVMHGTDSTLFIYKVLCRNFQAVVTSLRVNRSFKK